MAARSAQDDSGEPVPVPEPNVVISAFKLVYLYLVYWLVGLDEEGYQIRKGNYLVDLGWTPAAAKAYQRALEGTQSPQVHAMLGYCHLCNGAPDKAVVSLRHAYSRKPSPYTAISLLQALVENGDADDADRLLEKLRSPKTEFPPPLRRYLDEAGERLSEQARLAPVRPIPPAVPE